MAQLSVRVSEEVRHRLRVRVAMEKSSVQAVLESAVLSYLESKGEDVSDLRELIARERADDPGEVPRLDRRAAGGV